MQEFLKEKEKMRETIGKIGGEHNSQYYIVSGIFIALIASLLIMGVALNKIELQVSILIAILIGIFKILWMFYQVRKSIHFEFWILNSIEFRMNDIDERIRNVEKSIQELKKEIE